MNVLAIRDLEVRRGARPVVRGVSLDVTRGEILAVMGASGAGKTSVLRAVPPVRTNRLLPVVRIR